MAMIMAVRCSSSECFPGEPPEYPLHFFICNSQKMYQGIKQFSLTN